jgi:Holliday junction resolvase RusA-like endonuclease
MSSQQFFIPGRLPGMNDILQAAKLRKPYMRIKKQLTDMIAQLALEGDVKPYESSVCITFQWIEQNRKRDPDNICAGAKFVLDGLVKAGIIKSDGFKYVKTISSSFQINKEHPGVIVILETV